MFRLSPFRVAQLLLLLVPTLSAAQGIPSNRQTSCNVQVRVTFDDERAAGDQIRVALMNDSGIPLNDTFTDAEGRATFHVDFPGQYQVQVSGSPIKGKSVAAFRVDDMDKSKTIFVHVKPAGEPASAATKPNTQPVTSAAELRVPGDARKAFHKGMDAWEHNDYPKAAEFFERCVAIYPEYDTAYNNLGVMYYQMKQTEKARAAFEKSVALNDRNADADRNLARILIHDGDFPRAEELLKKSLVVEPLNPVSLTLICVAEIQTGDDDDVLMNARKVHSLPHEGYSIVHYVAGQALEHKGEPQAARAEYETYLQESPSGPEASQVKTALTRIVASNQPSPQ